MTAAPRDPLAEAAAEVLSEIVFGADASVTYSPDARSPTPAPESPARATATTPGPNGSTITLTVSLRARVAQLLDNAPSPLAELLAVLPAAGLRAADRLRGLAGSAAPPPAAVRRAVRDTVAAEILGSYLSTRLACQPRDDLVADTIDYLIEISGTRVEAHDLTHGVVIADVLHDVPRLEFRYPDDLRSAKRAPLLFDGRRSVLVVDALGRARTELQRHRPERFGSGPSLRPDSDGWLDSGSLVARATSSLGGVGFFVRTDRSIWTFADGQPLLVRRAEHWTAFPIELAASISNMIGGGPAAALVARAAFMISARPQGAILAIVGDRTALSGVVPLKDRYDLRDDMNVSPVRPETRLHHLIDAADLDAETLARLAELDGATVIDRDAKLVAYGAIVTSGDSEHEGARTAAARTLSQAALVVLKVSVDGDITIFRSGEPLTTLLGRPSEPRGARGDTSSTAT